MSYVCSCKYVCDIYIPGQRGTGSLLCLCNLKTYLKPQHFTYTPITDLHLKHVWKHHGLPLVHSTDHHGNFTSDHVRKLFKGLGIEQRFSMAFTHKHKAK